MAGTIAANAHGRGLKMKPFISDVESFVLVDATGTAHMCSRTENPELFRLVHGGYGLFGVVTSVRLRLVPRRKVERVVEIRTVDDLIAAFEKRITDGFQYGDFQFSIEQSSEDFLHKGVFSCYRPVPIDTAIPPAEKQLTDVNWTQLLYLAHTDEKQAFNRYADYYLSTNGQVYWSDLQQLSIYPDNYHREIDDKLYAPFPATEMITEIDVPRPALKGFLDEMREDFRKNSVALIYGTVRLIERDMRASCLGPSSRMRARSSTCIRSTAPKGLNARSMPFGGYVLSHIPWLRYSRPSGKLLPEVRRIPSAKEEV
jgi:FAD/FMN-containing dehydrogenase